MDKEKSAFEKLEELYKEFWRQKGDPQIIAAKHSEFMVEPKVFVGNKLNPEILNLLVVNYLANTSTQDSGAGNNIDISPDKLVIKSPRGKPLVIVRDKKIIAQYMMQQA
ncbi:hypothetical protein ACFL5U_00170 [Candidatus Margulisiibacteriota bacterium]